MRKLILATAVLAAAVLFAAMPASAGNGPKAQVLTSGDNSERVKTIPIVKRRGEAKRVVMNLHASRVGHLPPRSAFHVSAEVEVTTCIKANRRHPGARDRCIGKPYSYNPHVEGQLVLANSAEAVNGIPLTAPASLTCGQRLPARNHHCVIAIPWTRYEVTEELPCNPTCHVNLVMSSWHRNAKGGNKLVIGAHSRGPIVQDKGRINMVRFDSTQVELPKPIEDTKPNVKSLPIARDGGKAKSKVIFAVPIKRPRVGDKFMAEAHIVARIGGVRYNVELPSQMKISRSANTIGGKGVAMYTRPSTDLSEFNGVNCTQRKSAHSNPCVRDKFGIVAIKRDTNKGRRLGKLWINVTLSAEAKLTTQRWRPSDKVKIAGGYLRVWRFN